MAGPIRPERNGDYTVELDPLARDLLEHMCSEMDALLVSDSPLLQRLFPPPYGDDRDRNEGYAALAVPELIEHRVAAIETLRSTLRAERLTPEELMAWMRCINDMRLVLGTLLGIEDDGITPEVPSERADSLEIYEFLGYLLEMVVSALGSALPEEGVVGDDDAGPQ